MPYSTPTPVVVLPDTDLGREERRRIYRDVENVCMCGRYKEDKRVNTEQYARLRGLDVTQVGSWEIRNVCENRDMTGDRRHNWCFRCPAGYMFWAPPDQRDAKPGDDIATTARIRVH